MTNASAQDGREDDRSRVVLALEIEHGTAVRVYPVRWSSWRLVAPDRVELLISCGEPKIMAARVAVNETDDAVRIGLEIGRKSDQVDTRAITAFFSARVVVQLDKPPGTRTLIDASGG